MAERKPAAKTAKSSARSTSGKSTGFSADERAAMRERAKELKAAAEGENAESAVLEKLASMAPSDRAMGERLHALIRATAPGLAPRLWYGMPAYAKDGTVLCFFQGAQKFKTRYSTLGFSDAARLDDGQMWPTGFALMELSPAVEAQIVALLKRAVG